MDEPKEEAITREEVHNYIKTAVSSLGPDVPKEKKIEHAKILAKIFEKGMLPKEAMGISDEEIAQIYSFAYHNFATGHYEEARELFKMLRNLDPLNAEFATALGVCHHRLKDFEYALQCYFLSTILDPQNPVPLFYAYDCFTNLNNELGAGMMLCNVIKKAEDKPEYEHIKNDAQLRLDALEKKIIQDQANKTEKTS